jgi:signal transduction histidine kinase
MRLRLVGVLVAVVLAILVVQDLPLVSHLHDVERDRLVTRLERDAFVLAGRVEEALENDLAASDIVLTGLVQRYEATEGVSVVVVDDAAVAVIGPSFDPAEDFSNRPEIMQALSGAPVTGERQSVTLGEPLFFVAVPILSGDATIGAIRITAPASAVTSEVNSRLIGLALVVGVAILLAVGAALVFAGAVVRPVEQLTRVTKAFANGDRSQRADPNDGPPELRSLAQSFNTMAVQVNQLLDRQRAFAGTASHQLRTPLTALRIRLESLAETHTNERDAEHLAAAIAETERLGRMIEGLLVLSSVDASSIQPEPLHLGPTIQERAETWTPLAEEQGVTLTVTGRAQPPAVMVVPTGLDQMIDNLIDNALEVSPNGSTIEIRVDEHPDRVDVHVIDQGPGLPAEERQQAFDRFWRSPSAASGGTGLGLSIVRQLADASGGSARLDDNPDGGIDAVISLPRAPR